MSKKKPETVKGALRKLRQEVINGDDPVASRIAYEMECAVRWATEDTHWPSLSEFARDAARLLRAELGIPEGNE